MHYPGQLSRELRGLAQQLGATLFMVLLAAFEVLLYYHGGQEDQLIGTDLANRRQRELEELIGCFTNQVVLRVSLAGNPSYQELVGRVREVALGAYAHQDLPFEKLVSALQPQRTLSTTPIFQIKFALQNAPTSRLETSSFLSH